MGNIFLEKSYTKCGGDSSPRKIKIEHISGLIVLSFIVFFMVCKVECYRNILRLSCKPLPFNSN